MERMCSMCREVKDENEFSICTKRQNGKLYYYRRSYCKKCQRIYNSEYMRAYREMNPDYVKRNQIRMRNKMRAKYNLVKEINDER